MNYLYQIYGYSKPAKDEPIIPVKDEHLIPTKDGSTADCGANPTMPVESNIETYFSETYYKTYYEPNADYRKS